MYTRKIALIAALLAAPAAHAQYPMPPMMDPAMLNQMMAPMGQMMNPALMNQMMQNLASQGMAQQDLKLDPSMFREQAERRVKLGLIMSEIVKQHDLHVDPDKVKAMVESIAAPYEHPEEVVKWYYGDKRRLAEVESLVFEEQVVDWVMEQVKVKEKSIDFNELMNPEAGA